MAWAVPNHNRGRVDAAGRQLVDDAVAGEVREIAREIVNNWRASHHYPLLATRITLNGRATRVDPRAIVAQRIKKLSSIEVKLRRNANMKLSQMQDVGGCRAILPTVTHVDELVAAYSESDAKNPNRSKQAREPYDYIANPKDDGYRGIHLVYKYKSSSARHAVYDGHRIEIQIRSRYQHYWATAVEVVDTISQESIKAGKGERDWRRFFALLSSAMAMSEKRTLVPNTPTGRVELEAEIADLARKLRVASKLSSYAASVSSDSLVAGKVFLLTLNLNSRETKVRGFETKEVAEASEAYFAAERASATNPNLNSVLVTLDKLKNLRTAYPNYYLDTNEFLRFLNRLVLRHRLRK